MTEEVMSRLGAAAARVVTDAWTTSMLGFWSAALWLLRLVLHVTDLLTTPDMTSAGPAGLVYRSTYWIAAVMVLLLAVVQMGVSLVRRDGKSLGTLVVGTCQFGLVWVAWIGYSTAVVAACGAINTALRDDLLSVDVLQVLPDRGAVQTITDTTVATVLGLLGIELWFAALLHLIVMLARAGALLVLVATAPIAAAGLVSDLGKSWFWKCFRWFHAAAFTPILMTLVMGIGMKLASGVAQGLTSTPEKSIATALPAVVLILIAAISPWALFKLLAFVDPDTTSGASLRAGLAAEGGLSGLLHQARSAHTALSTPHSSGDGAAGQTAATTARTAAGVTRLNHVGQAATAALTLPHAAATVMTATTGQQPSTTAAPAAAPARTSPVPAISDNTTASSDNTPPGAANTDGRPTPPPARPPTLPTPTPAKP